MSSAYSIPLSPVLQTFRVSLGGVTYTINLYWNPMAGDSGSWVVDLLDATGTVKILPGIPLVANTDLLAPYAYMNFGGQLIAQTSSDVNAPPTSTNLGSSSGLYFVTP